MTNKTMQILLTLRDEASKRLTTFRGKMMRTANAIKRSWFEIGAAILSVKKAFDVLEFGAKVEQQRIAFESLTASVGVNLKKLIEDLRKMSGETLSNAQVIEKASQAIILGLDPEKLSKLMEISRASARAFGTDVGFMFESIVTGIGRQSKLILDNLGIVVSAKDAYELYAQSIGKTAKQLTDAEKKKAFFNATLKAGEEILSKVNVQAKTNFERIQSLKAIWTNLSETLGKLFLTSIQLSVMFFHQARSGFAIVSSVALNFFATFLKSVRGMMESWHSFTSAMSETFARAIQSMVRPLVGLIENFALLDRFLADKTKLSFFAKEAQALESISKSIKSWAEGLNDVSQSQEQLESLDSKIDVIEQLIDRTNQWRDGFGSVAGEQMQIADEIQKIILKTEELSESQKQALAEIHKARQEALGNDTQDTESAFKYKEELARQSARNMQNAFSQFFFKAFTGELKSLKDVFADFGRSVLQMLSNILAKLLVMRMLQSFAGGPSGSIFGLPIDKIMRFHSGGFIQRAHSGMLGYGERPIIGQIGEGVLSRKGMNTLGSSNFLRLNRGESLDSGQVIQPTIIIKAFDASDIFRNRKQIESIVVSGLRSNSSLRGAIKQYA